MRASSRWFRRPPKRQRCQCPLSCLGEERTTHQVPRRLESGRPSPLASALGEVKIIEVRFAADVCVLCPAEASNNPGLRPGLVSLDLFLIKATGASPHKRMKFYGWAEPAPTRRRSREESIHYVMNGDAPCRRRHSAFATLKRTVFIDADNASLRWAALLPQYCRSLASIL